MAGVESYRDRIANEHWREVWEYQAYGTTGAEVKRQLEAHMARNDVHAATVVFSMLSDVQALVELGRSEQARQALNRAKLIVSEYLKPEHAR